jgi:uncharacterized protein (TIGR03083 family)
MITTAHLFSELDAALVALLKSLSRDEWHAPTIVPRWNVHQVAAHLLDTALRRLSLCRDHWSVRTVTPQPPRELVALVNELNADGVRVYGALSPELLIALTELVTPELASYLASLDPHATATFAVSWAGETVSANWFDVAREFTERWHHQQQIRLATQRPGLVTPRLYKPVLETFMRVLPHAYGAVDAPVGTACDVIVPGECGGRWRVVREARGWMLGEADGDARVAATAIVPADLAWRLMTKGASEAEAVARIRVEGDRRLGTVIFSARAIVG